MTDGTKVRPLDRVQKARRLLIMVQDEILAVHRESEYGKVKEKAIKAFDESVNTRNLLASMAEDLLRKI